MNPIELIDKDSMRDDIPDFAPGDTVKVHVKVIEGNRQRVQIFEGVGDPPPGRGAEGNLHRPQAELRRRRGAHLPVAHAECRKDRASDPGRPCVGPSSITCATASASGPRSKKSATASGSSPLGSDAGLMASLHHTQLPGVPVEEVPAVGADRRQRFGAAGERRVANWYRARGYRVVGQNWSCRNGELDLILERGPLVVFCEVKTRANARFGAAVEAVTWRKQRRIRSLAVQWLAASRRSYPELRFDVATIQAGRIQVIEGAF